MNTGVKPNRLWHWAVITVLAATFLAEPAAAFALTWELFRGAGAVGGELITGGTGGDADLLNLEEDPPFNNFTDDQTPGTDEPNNDDTTPTPDPGPAARELEGASAPGGCRPDDSCVYGFELPAPDTVRAEAVRLRELTNGAIGVLQNRTIGVG